MRVPSAAAASAPRVPSPVRAPHEFSQDRKEYLRAHARCCGDRRRTQGPLRKRREASGDGPGLRRLRPGLAGLGGELGQGTGEGAGGGEGVLWRNHLPGGGAHDISSKRRIDAYVIFRCAKWSGLKDKQRHVSGARYRAVHRCAIFVWGRGVPNGCTHQSDRGVARRDGRAEEGGGSVRLRGAVVAAAERRQRSNRELCEEASERGRRGISWEQFWCLEPAAHLSPVTRSFPSGETPVAHTLAGFGRDVCQSVVLLPPLSSEAPAAASIRASSTSLAGSWKPGFCRGNSASEERPSALMASNSYQNVKLLASLRRLGRSRSGSLKLSPASPRNRPGASSPR